MTEFLPVFEIQSAFLGAVEKGRVVVTAPTGSGKSTELPRWLAKTDRVLVIEPRRVACLGLCERVSYLEGSNVGDRVGYHVRGQSRFDDRTQILFVTPGIALRYFSSLKLQQFSAVVLDEFHERGIETDLLLALLKKNFAGKLVVTSATINAAPIAEYLGARVLKAKGTLYDVAVKYVGPTDALPSAERLDDRVNHAVELAMAYSGDILVFLPGKSEIRRVAQRLAAHPQLDVMMMHGDLGLGEQEKVFGASQKRKVVLSTNVCETSITVPGIGVVIDSGLVRRTRFVDNRGFLTLMPIAGDSADQRKGRAGRTAAGVCFRLWSERAVLESYTPAEIYRESLTQMVLATASCGERMDTIDFYEAPREYAVAAAESSLLRLGALDTDRRITARGRALFGLPISADRAALLVDAEQAGMLKEAIDVVSVAETPKELFISGKRPENPEDDFRLQGCDVKATLLAMQCPLRDAARYEIHPGALREAQKLRNELRAAFGIDRKAPVDAGLASELARLFVRTDPRCAYVARRKRGRVFFANGDGKEITLSAASAILEEKVETIVVFATVATGLGYREKDARILVTMASPLKRAELAALGVGQMMVSAPQLVKGKVIAKVEQVHAGCILSTGENIPTGEGAITAIAELFLRGSVFADQLRRTTQRLSEAALLGQVLEAGLGDEMLDMGPYTVPVPSLEMWLRNQLMSLGIDSGADFELLDESDFLAPALPEWSQQWIQSRFPLSLNVGDAQYNVEYDFRARQVTLLKYAGTRKGPPSIHTVPSFGGFKIKVKHHTQTWMLRA